MVIFDIGYEPVPTSEPEEALRLIRLGRGRMVFASVHVETAIPVNSLSSSPLRSPRIQVIRMAARYALARISHNKLKKAVASWHNSFV
jgi:hypothetical protein